MSDSVSRILQVCSISAKTGRTHAILSFVPDSSNLSAHEECIGQPDCSRHPESNAYKAFEKDLITWICLKL